MPHLVAIGAEHLAFLYFCQKPFPRFVNHLITNIELFFNFIAMMKMKDTSVPAVVLNPAILALAALGQDQFDLSLSVILLFVFLSGWPITMVPFAFILSRIIVFSAIVPVNVALRPAIPVKIFCLLATTTGAFDPNCFIVYFVMVPPFNFTLCQGHKNSLWVDYCHKRHWRLRSNNIECYIYKSFNHVLKTTNRSTRMFLASELKLCTERNSIEQRFTVFIKSSSDSIASSVI